MAVTNPYYEFTPTFVAGATVRAGEVNTQYQAIQNAFDFLPGANDALTTGTATFAPESGSANAYVVTMPDTRTANTDGDEIIFFASHGNSGAATLNVDGLGAIALVDRTGAALISNDIVSGRLYMATYDASNTRFVLDVTTNVVTNIIDKVQGSSTDVPTDVGAILNATLDFVNANDVEIASLQFGIGGGNFLSLFNKAWSGSVRLYGTDVSGSQTLLLSCDPDGATSLRYGSNAAANTTTLALGSFEINNTLTGSGQERALTVSDVGITATTTELEQDTDPINTDPAKVQGYMVYNTTTGIPYWADGPGDADTWSNATGAVVHTPV